MLSDGFFSQFHVFIYFLIYCIFFFLLSKKLGGHGPLPRPRPVNAVSVFPNSNKKIILGIGRIVFVQFKQQNTW